MKINRFLSTSLCFLVLSGMSVFNAYAQEEGGDGEETTVEKPSREKKEKQYEMKTVKGVITDASTGEPMGGVRIQALGLDRYSTLTEEDGTYTLDIPVFSDALYLYAEGYNPLQVAVKEGKADASMITGQFNPFYTEGTTITSQRTVTLDETSSMNVDVDIEKKLAGDIHAVLRSGSPGQGNFMTIRGVNSINANTQPLIVLDGNIIDPQYDRDAMHEGFYNNLLASIDPENIESIQVLKNGTTLYGAKGGNGVIIINTKRGKSMATKINVRIYGGMEFIPKKLDMLSGNDYTTYLTDLVSTIKDMKPGSLSRYPFLDQSPSNYYRNVYSNNTDWQKDMYQNAFTQNYKLSVEGGDDIGMYALSLGYASTEGTAKGLDMDRLNLRFNTDIKIFEKLKTGLDIAYNQNSYNILDTGWSDDYSMQNIGSTNVLGLIQAPFISPYAWYYDENSTASYPSGRLSLSEEYAGKYAADGSNSWVTNPFLFSNSLGFNESLRNPYWILENGDGKMKNYAQSTQIDLNVSPRWEVTKTFSISDRFNFLMTRNNEKYYLPRNGATPYTLKDLGSISSVLKTMFAKETTLQNDLRLEWANKYGAHSIDVFGGWRYNNYAYSYNYMSGYNNENDKLPIISKDMAYINYGGTNDNWMDMTYYLDASYNYKNRYFAEFTASAQTSSRFGRNTDQGIKVGGVCWGLFPSLQLGWVISNEKWFKTGNGVDYLKLTAGVEQSGNDGITDYYASRTYWESQKVFSNVVGLYLKNIENSGIQWETTTKWNIGLQGSFLKNRLQAGLDLYWHKTSNLLTVKELSYISGMNKYWTNEGELTNRGFEFSTNAILINRKNWKWEVGATLGHYNNKITKLPGGERNTIKMSDVNGNNRYEINGYTSSIYGTDNVITAVGYALGSFYGWQTNGVFADEAAASQATSTVVTWQDAAGNSYSNDGHLLYPTGKANGEDKYRNFQSGDICFVDQNGDGVIDDADKVVIGNPNPDIYGNIFTSLTWKDLRLDVNFKYSLGNDVYNYQRSIVEGLNTSYNQTKAVLRRWTYEGQNTDMPKACYTNSDDWRNNERMSDRWIEDGSFLKLKNIRLTYTVPYSNSWLLGLKVWAEGNNLFTISKYLGTDPEMSSSNNVLYQGIDTGLVPCGRGFNVGVSINL